MLFRSGDNDEKQTLGAYCTTSRIRTYSFDLSTCPSHRRAHVGLQRQVPTVPRHLPQDHSTVSTHLSVPPAPQARRAVAFFTIPKNEESFFLLRFVGGRCAQTHRVPKLWEFWTIRLDCIPVTTKLIVR